MKAILKVITIPIALILDLFTWFCVGMISCSAIIFQLVSGLLALFAFAVIITDSTQNGLILLTLAFLVSPMGLPMLAVKLLSGLQYISSAIKTI